MKNECLKIPKHIAIIMDGNGRWAKLRNLPRTRGHFAGAEAVRTCVEEVFRLGVNYLTLYAFSSENWNRPKEEVQALMELLILFLKEYETLLKENEISFTVIGDISPFSDEIQSELKRLIKETEHFQKNHLIIALNYGSRTEVLRAVKSCIIEFSDQPEALTWDEFSKFLYTKNIPDPDLLIRTSGETRVSNFLLLQIAYTEFFFTPVLWPDFGKKELLEAIEYYSSRERRFGKISEQIQEDI